VIRAFAALTAMIALGLCGGTAVVSAAVGSNGLGVGFIKPLAHSSVSQGFGCSSFAFEPVDRACPGGHWHSGIDLAAARGTPVMATLPGSVAVIVSQWARCSGLVGAVSMVASPAMFQRLR